MIGIVDVGGGMRGVFGCGVTDFLLDNDITFDYCLGVSAGSANLASYVSRQRGRNYRYYTKYSLRPEYMSAFNFVTKHSFFDLDYVYSVLSDSDGEDPLDYKTLSQSNQIYKAVATNGETGVPHYFTKDDFRQDFYEPLKASSAIPGVCKPVSIDGTDYFDGGVSDPIPVEKALADGCDHVFLILTKPIDFVKKPEMFKSAYTKVLKKYPAVIKKLNIRHETYNNEIKRALELSKEGKVTIIAPDDGYSVTAFTRNIRELNHLYNEGYKKAGEILKNKGYL